MGLFISEDGYTFLIGLGLSEEFFYQEDGEWYVDLGELIDFLESIGATFDEETYSIYLANMQPSQKGIFIGAN